MPHQSPLPFRRLAIHVEEPRSGAFRWVLSELYGSDALLTLQRAETTSATYHAAMASGLRALEAQVDDLDIGPRQEDVPSAPPCKNRSAEASRKSTAFGFGLPS